MGAVLRFPAERVRGALYPAPRPEPADILILPVVRIEREGDSGDTDVHTGSSGAGNHGGRGSARRS